MLSEAYLLAMWRALKDSDPWPELTQAWCICCAPAAYEHIVSHLRWNNPYGFNGHIKALWTCKWMQFEDVYLARDMEEATLLEDRDPHITADKRGIPAYEIKDFIARLKAYKGTSD